MAYSDGLMLLPGSLNLATGATVRAPSFDSRQVETAAADLAEYVFPFPVQIEGFGLIVTEDFAAQTTEPVFSLDVESPAGGSRVELLTLTISQALKFGNGLKAAQTAIVDETAIDVGDVIMSNSVKLPKKINAGDKLIVEHKTAAGAAGGAVVPVLLVRVAGFDLTSENVLS